jgi:hypothetical protein
MVIKASAAAEVTALVKALAGAAADPRAPRENDVQREAAVARLSVIGGRAIDKLHRAYAATTDLGTRLAILRTLEAIPDQRNLPLAADALAAGGDVAVAAIGVLRALLTTEGGAAGTEALEALVTTAVAASDDRRLRVAALDALSDVPGNVRARVAHALGAEAEGAAGAGKPDDVDRQQAAGWEDALDGRLPDAPQALRDVVSARAAAAPLNSLRKLIDAVHGRETGADASSREGWRALRGSLHQSLALRGSRVALYDLRESIPTGGEPLPPSFLAALHVIGDETCLDPLAAAWASARDERWRHQLAGAFKAIASRERVSKRHAAARRILARVPAAVELWG